MELQDSNNRIFALPPLVDAGCTILIPGTVPGKKSIGLRQYYANPGNAFRKLIFAVFDEHFTESYSERIKILQKHGIALWEVLGSCERTGSSDNNIKNEAPNDIEAIPENLATDQAYFL